MDNHVSTDVVDNDLWQPVHAAACWGHVSTLSLSLSLSLRSFYSVSPIVLFCQNVPLYRQRSLFFDSLRPLSNFVRSFGSSSRRFISLHPRHIYSFSSATIHSLVHPFSVQYNILRPFFHSLFFLSTSLHLIHPSPHFHSFRSKNENRLTLSLSYYSFPY